MGDFGIVDSIMGKMGLVDKQNVTYLLGIGINPVADFEPSSHTCRLKLLTALCVVWEQSFCVCCSTDTHVRNAETGESSSFNPVCTSLHHANNVFLFLQISLYLTFSFAVYTLQGAIFSQEFMNTAYVNQGFAIKDIVASILPQQEWHYCCKTHTQNAYWCVVLRKAACSQLLLTVHLSQDELTVLFAILCTAGMVVIT
jgi:hypothetical protein